MKIVEKEVTLYLYKFKIKRRRIMKKKMLLIVATIALMIYVPSVSAATIEVADDASLVDAFKKAVTGDTIKLTKDVTHDGSYIMVDEGRTLTFDLNGFNLTTVEKKENRSITVSNGNLTVTGKGTITMPGHNALAVWGSKDKDAKDYSVLTVEKDVTLVGKYGVAIFENQTKINKDAYGVKVTFAGKAKATDTGITVQGNIKNENGPVIAIKDGAEIVGDEIGLYSAGNSTWTIGNAKVSGKSALGIKSGTLTINGGTFLANGESKDPKEYGNGINSNGSTILIESNSSYYGKINLTINGGTFISTNRFAFEEYITSSGVLNVDSLKINGGTFTSSEDNVTFMLSNALSAKIPTFINGGTYNNDVSMLLNAGYKSYVNEDGNVVVEKINVKEGTYKILGKVTDSEEGAIVQLKQGAKVLQISKVDDKGEYAFTNVAKGTYTLVVVDAFGSTSKYVKVDKDVTIDLTIGNVGTRIVYVGNDTPDVAVDGLDEVIARNEITMLIGKDVEETDAHKAIKENIKAENYDFLEIELADGEEIINETYNVLMFAVPYNLEGKTNIAIARYHGQAVDKFKKLTAMPENKDAYKDGTYYVDEEEGMIYIFASKFSSYAITYDNANAGGNTIANPQTSDSILSFVGMMFAAIALSGVGTYYYKKRKQTN